MYGSANVVRAVLHPYRAEAFRPAAASGQAAKSSCIKLLEMASGQWKCGSGAESAQSSAVSQVSG